MKMGKRILAGLGLRVLPGRILTGRDDVAMKMDKGREGESGPESKARRMSLNVPSHVKKKEDMARI